MRKLPRFISRQFGKIVPFNSLVKISTPVFQPFYHVVSNQKLPHILNYLYKNITDFEKELEFFLKHFKPISLDDLYSKKFNSEKVFHLSFDDGLKECVETIAPVLLKKGIPATFFVNPGFVDNKALFHRYKASLIFSEIRQNNVNANRFLAENGISLKNILQTSILKVSILDEAAQILGIDFNRFLAEQKPYLSTGQILELSGKGFSIGAHSLNHPEFWLISEEEQYRQIKESMNWVNKTIQPEIKAFAFPYTDDGASAMVLKKVKSNGICDITFGTAGIKYDELDFHYQRYPVEQHGDLRTNLKEELVYFKLRNYLGKSTVKH